MTRSVLNKHPYNIPDGDAEVVALAIERKRKRVCYHLLAEAEASVSRVGAGSGGGFDSGSGGHSPAAGPSAAAAVGSSPSAVDGTSAQAAPAPPLQEPPPVAPAARVRASSSASEEGVIGADIPIDRTIWSTMATWEKMVDAYTTAAKWGAIKGHLLLSNRRVIFVSVFCKSSDSVLHRSTPTLLTDVTGWDVSVTGTITIRKGKTTYSYAIEDELKR